MLQPTPAPLTVMSGLVAAIQHLICVGVGLVGNSVYYRQQKTAILKKNPKTILGIFKKILSLSRHMQWTIQDIITVMLQGYNFWL